MQLQQNLEAFTAAGVRVFAISNDPVDALAAFAEEQGITYPLLSDGDSAVIRQYGILNTLIRPDESVYGIPYPGLYATDGAGVVTEKRFYRTYRTRPSAQSVLHDLFGAEFDAGGDPHAEAAGDGVRISAVLAADALYLMQRTPLYVRIDLDPGLHVYRAPVPEGFVATTVEVTAPEEITIEPPSYPPAHPFRVEGIAQEFQVMDGRVEIEVPLMATTVERETVRVTVVVRYQACDDRQCFIPRTETLTIDLPLRPLNRPVRR